MPRPARPCRLPLLALLLCGGLAGTPALAFTDPDDPPPLTPIRDPAPVEPAPPQIVLASARLPGHAALAASSARPGRATAARVRLSGLRL